MEKDKNLYKVLMMSGIFRLDHGRWPQNAAELKAFTEEKGWNLDFSPYHTLTFQTDAWRCLVVEVSWLEEGDWLTRRRFDVEPYFFEKGLDQSIPLRIQSRALSPLKAELRSYCPVAS
jgi:hypothetical protein